MKTLTSVPAYKMQSRTGVVSCAPYTSYFELFRDVEDSSVKAGSWEKFTDDSLKSYFINGMAAFSKKLEKLTDQNQPYSQEDAEELSFMLESLVYARQLLQEI